MTYAIPPIAKLSERLLVDIDKAVCRFARRHRYSVGKKLLRQAFKIAQLAQRAGRDRARRAHWVGKLVWLVDDFKLTMQLCQQLRAFASFAQFEAFALVVQDLGRQAGAWHRAQQHPKAQSAESS